jgi:hypothetical protein
MSKRKWSDLGLLRAFFNVEGGGKKLKMSKTKSDAEEADLDKGGKKLWRTMEFKAYFNDHYDDNDDLTGTRNYSESELRRQAFHCPEWLSEYEMRRRLAQGNILKEVLPVVREKTPQFCAVLDYLQTKDLGPWLGDDVVENKWRSVRKDYGPFPKAQSAIGPNLPARQ